MSARGGKRETQWGPWSEWAWNEQKQLMMRSRKSPDGREFNIQYGVTAPQTAPPEEQLWNDLSRPRHSQLAQSAAYEESSSQPRDPGYAFSPVTSALPLSFGADQPQVAQVSVPIDSESFGYRSQAPFQSESRRPSQFVRSYQTPVRAPVASISSNQSIFNDLPPASEREMPSPGLEEDLYGVEDCDPQTLPNEDEPQFGNRTPFSTNRGMTPTSRGIPSQRRPSAPYINSAGRFSSGAVNTVETLAQDIDSLGIQNRSRKESIYYPPARDVIRGRVSPGRNPRKISPDSNRRRVSPGGYPHRGTQDRYQPQQTEASYQNLESHYSYMPTSPVPNFFPRRGAGMSGAPNMYGSSPDLKSDLEGEQPEIDALESFSSTARAPFQSGYLISLPPPNQEASMQPHPQPSERFKDMSYIPAASTKNSEMLDREFRFHNSKEFQRGRIFKVVWSEPVPVQRAGLNSSDGSNYSRSRFGEGAYHSVRRFVIVKANKGHCLCLPILTYGRQGTAKRGVKPQDHAIIYVGKALPSELPGEPVLLKKPIRVEPLAARHKLDQASRINYSKIYTVEHNNKVCFIGRIDKDSEKTFFSDFRSTFDEDND